ncbi:MAG: hypothetical protein LBU42_05305, partial [Prevotellaceae bacterium]|nr:hypothetical protein [Prevotellaceae bacterium]
SSYTLAGTPPFLLIASNGATSLTVPGTTIATAAVTFTPAIITDATGYPGLWCPYTGTDLYMDATHRCLQRQSGAGNWEAWIKDTRDNHLYRIVQMPTNTWWMAEDLMWDGKPNPTATGYTIRGHARSCGAHYGCGRFYNSTATGAGAYSGNANSRRTNNVCPTQWVIPSSREFCDYATSTQNPQPYLGTAELGGPDSHGLSLWICASESWNCGTVHTAYVAGSGAVHYWYRPAGHVPPAPCNDTYEGGGSRNVRCVRDL